MQVRKLLPAVFLVALYLQACIFACILAQDAPYLSTDNGNVLITSASGMGIFLNNLNINDAIANITAQFAAYMAQYSTYVSRQDLVIAQMQQQLDTQNTAISTLQ